MVAQTRPVYVTPAPLPGFRLAQLVAANGARPAPTPQIVTANVAPVPAPMPADLSQQAAVQAATNLAAPTAPPAPAYPSQDVIGAWLSETYKLGAPPSALGQTAPSAPLLPPVEIGGEQPVDPMISGSIDGAANDNAPGSWIVQIGASPTEESARILLSDATSKLTHLQDYRPYVERFDWNGQVFYRARFTGFGGREDATDACNQLKEQNLTCLAMQS
jgi:D-alanyl-D-alanine carboxypeptidase